MNKSFPCETVPLFPVGSPTELIPPRYLLGAQSGSYVGRWTGQPVAPRRSEDEASDWVRTQRGYCRPYPGPAVCNYMVRRDPVAMVSGDLPRFALLDYKRTRELNPMPHLLGDVRIRVKIAEQSLWLDEHGAVETHYFPWGTEHRVELDHLTFTVAAALIGTCGMALSVTIVQNAALRVEVLLCYGGLGVAQMTGGDRPECLLLEPAMEANDRIVIADGAALLTDEAIPYAVKVQADTADAVQLIEGSGDIIQRAAFRWLLTERTTRLHLVAGKQFPDAPVLDPARAEQYIAETRQYYTDLLADVAISTPDTLLDAAFYTSVVGMDYAYAAPGWLEGLTGWASYFCNNYQLSAAVALRQDALAREALRYFALNPAGPGQVVMADGHVDAEKAQDDGFPYFVVQLYDYWKATGDHATLAEVWQPSCRMLEHFIALRDGDGDGLLDFHRGCNAFLYQADHLSLPGAAFSPSVMLAAMLRRMAEMAAALGEEAQSVAWRRQADRIDRLLIERLWSAQEGRFLAAIDPQGRPQVASYYTDFAFPALYSDLPIAQRYLPLLAMDRALSLGPCLLRTGNYKPDLFGNNAVHQVGMCEAAEAQFREGRAQRGWELLHGTAAGATVISYCPGTMYEFASWDGQGLNNKHFGNPIGSYVRAVVTGLFGYIRTAAPSTQVWQPSIPASWPHAHLRVGGTEMQVTGAARSRGYRIHLDTPQAVTLRLPLYGQAPVSAVDAAGNEVLYTLVPHPAGGVLQIELPAAAEHAVTVTLLQAPTQREFSPTLPSAAVAHPAPGTLCGRRESLDLTTHFNSDRIRPDSFWRNTRWRPGNELTYDLRPYLAPGGGLTVVDYEFTVRPTGQNLVALSLGDLDPVTNLPQAASVPSNITIEIGRGIGGLEFLTVAEPWVRLLGMEVGCVECRYADGGTQTIPLIVGKQLDATLSPYATQASSRKLAKGNNGLSKHLSAWHVAVDAARKTDTVTVRITSYDIMLGILGINARVVDDL